MTRPGDAQHGRAASRDDSLYGSILETTLDGFITIDRYGVVIDVNPVAEAMFGWQRDELIGQLLSETIIPPDHRELHERGLAHYRATGHGPVLGKRIELEGLHKSGRVFPLEIAIASVEIHGGEVFTAFLRDLKIGRAHV